MSSLMAEAPAEAHATRRFLRVVSCPALLPSAAVTPLVVLVAGLAAIAVGSLLLRSYGPRMRVGRLLAVTPRVSIAEARALAISGGPRYVRVDGRLDADAEFPDENHRPLVLRRRRLEARRGAGWRTLDEQRDAVPFRVREGLDEIDVDEAALDVGLVTLVREAVGTAAEAAGRPGGLAGAAARRHDRSPADRAALDRGARRGARRAGVARRRTAAAHRRDRTAARRQHARAGRGDAGHRRRPPDSSGGRRRLARRRARVARRRDCLDAPCRRARVTYAGPPVRQGMPAARCRRPARGDAGRCHGLAAAATTAIARIRRDAARRRRTDDAAAPGLVGDPLFAMLAVVAVVGCSRSAITLLATAPDADLAPPVAAPRACPGTADGRVTGPPGRRPAPGTADGRRPHA